MAITRTRKENDEPFFQTPTAQIFEDIDHERDGKKPEDQDDKYDKLASQIADLAKQNEELRNSQMAMLTTPSRSQVQEVFVPQDPNKIELPDPALDPNGYDNAVARRNEIRSSNQQRQQEINQRRLADQTEKVENLWDAFSDKYPDMSEDKEKVDFVATQVSKAAQRRGLDVERYMFGPMQDKYLADVAKKYVEVFGEPEGEDDFEDTTSRRRASSRTDTRSSSRRRNREEDDNVGRTGGVFGGNESGGRPSSRSRDDDEDARQNSMIDDLQALQRKTGFF